MLHASFKPSVGVLTRSASRVVLRVALALVLTYAFSCAGLISSSAAAADANAAAPRNTIAVFKYSRTNGCFDLGSARAIEQLVDKRIASLNASLGVGEPRFEAVYFDDQGDPDKAISNVDEALALPRLVGMVGLASTRRSQAVFKALGEKIEASGVPFITDISLNAVFEKHSNVFTMRPSVDDERLPVLKQFIKDQGYRSPGFIGAADSIAIDTIVRGLDGQSGLPPLALTERIPVVDRKISSAALSAGISAIKTANPDALFVALYPESGRREFLKQATASGLTMPMFFLFGSEILNTDAAATYPNELHLMDWSQLPEVDNNRIRELMLASPSDNWLFPDIPRREAAGWSDALCQERGTNDSRDPLSSDNMASIDRALQYADMVRLIADVVASVDGDLSEPVKKKQRLALILERYAAGVGVFRGDHQNWSFRTTGRSANRVPAILSRQVGAKMVQLAPRQYARLRDQSLRPIQTVYMDIDLMRVFRIDDEGKSFFAEFFVSMNNADGLTLGDIEFGNAFLDAERKGPQLLITPVHVGRESGIYPSGMSIWKVVGRFMMTPNLAAYPFDTQLFTIQLKPKDGDTAFIIQPPPAGMRNSTADTDGWSEVGRYVGYDEDVIPIIDTRNGDRSVVPFYKMNFSWILKREATDYFLRVVVPLIFILIVAYLSIFIPPENFEAIVTIQVTALLSAVALYLSIPQIGSDSATISDRIFLFNYMATSFMIVISILRVNTVVRRYGSLDKVLRLAHVVGIPLLCAAMAYFVAQMEAGRALNWTFGLETMIPPQSFGL